MLFNNIPEDLKKLRQFLLWRYAKSGSVKLTKIPINAFTGLAASTTNPADWCSFGEAVGNVSKADGIGFVFSVDDEFAGIDLDDPKGDPDQILIHDRIKAQFQSYSEVSPSGSGTHIIVRGRLNGLGRRRGGVEIYDRGRYFTMTGNIAGAPKPIADYQPLLNILASELGRDSGSIAGVQPDEPETRPDSDYVRMILAEPHLAASYKIDGSANPTGVSEHDLALCNALARRCRNRSQTRRIWLASPLGQRQKTQRREDYQRATIERAFDQPALAGR